MKISVITVCYNNASTIEDTILSIDSQKFPHKEHIIIDGVSTDHTLNIIESHRQKISKFISEPDRGIYDAMNKGISLASGEIIGILNADDVYSNSGVLDKVATVFEDHNVGACYGDLVYVEQENLNKIVRYWKSCDYQNGLFKKGWVPAHPTFFARKTVYDAYGSYDLDFSLAADFELMLRFIEKYRVKTKYLPYVFVKMRMGGATNKSLSNIIKQNVEIYKAGRKNEVRISLLTLLFPKILSRIFQFINKPDVI